MEEASANKGSSFGEGDDQTMVQSPNKERGGGRLDPVERFDACTTMGNDFSEVDDESMARSAKKGRIDGKPDEKLDGNMKRVAEIVLVLAAMGQMRGGRSATDVERELVAEARKKLAFMWESLPPKELVPKDKRDALVEDLGLNRSNEQTGFDAPPRPSVAEKLRLTMKKIEESRELAAKTATYSSQIPHLGQLPNNRSPDKADATVKVLPDKLNSMSLSLTGFQPFTPVSQASGLASALIRSHLRTNEAPGMSVETLSSNLSDTEHTHSTLPAAALKHLKPEPGSCATAGDQMRGSFPGSFTQIPFASQERVCQGMKMPILDSAVEQKTHKGSLLSTSQPDTKISMESASSGSHTMHQVVQAVNSLGSSSTDSIHNDIARGIQKILQPGLHSHSECSPPSVAYMNASLTCEVCKATITDIGSLLVCDACEKGVHVKCLHVYNQKGIPQGEWHCPKCLMLNNGKSLAPKYGRIARTTLPRLPSSSKLQSSLEINVETADGKFNQHKLETSGGAKNHAPIARGSSAQNTIIDSKVFNIEKFTTQFSSAIEAENREKQPTNLNLTKEKMDPVVPSPNSEAEKIQIKDDILPQAEAGNSTITDETLLVEKNSSEDPCSLQQSATSSPDNLEPLKQAQPDAMCRARVCDGSSVSLTENLASSLEASNESSTCAVNLQEGQNGFQTTGGTVESSDCSRFADAGFPAVSWVGERLQVVDDKTYYQSCCINEVVYKLHDYAVLHSDDHSIGLYIAKLEALWEDNTNRTRWALVNRCYPPSDLPEIIGQPSSPEENEIYQSNHNSDVLLHLIRGPCRVMSSSKYREEIESGSQSGADSLKILGPLHLCKWLYDEAKGLFQPVSEA